MYMLPLATIVYNAHHTMLEVALPLTLNGVIDYRVGFYTSLLPKTTASLATTKEILGLLTKGENDSRNRLFLQWYKGGRVDGGVLFSRFEAQQIKSERLSAATELLKEAMALPLEPSRDDVVGVVKRLAPKFAPPPARVRVGW